MKYEKPMLRLLEITKLMWCVSGTSATSDGCTNGTGVGVGDNCLGGNVALIGICSYGNSANDSQPTCQTGDSANGCSSGSAPA